MDIGFDFFLFIAFFIPGVFILYSINTIYTPLRNFLVNEICGKENNKWLLGLSFCILLGMMSSIFRNMVIDKTFNIDGSNLPFVDGDKQWKAVTQVEPDYSKLNKDDLEVLKELKNEEKRPYQFYGNTIIAIFCFIGCSLAAAIRASNRQRWRQFWGLTLLLLIFSWILYTGSRFSHYHYMEGVKKMNNK